MLGKKTGGRTAGVPNKRTLQAVERLRELGCDPIEGMVRITKHKGASPELKGRMYAELAGYVFPKRKAVELGGPDGGPLDVAMRAQVVAYLPNNNRRVYNALPPGGVLGLAPPDDDPKED